MKKSQLGNGNVTSKCMQATKENGEQQIAEQMAAIVAGYPGGLIFLFEEFWKKVKKRQREAKQHNEPIPMLLEDLTDLTGAWQLVMLLADEQVTVWGQGDQEEDILLKFFTSNEEARHLMMEILMDMHPIIAAKLMETELTDPAAMKSNLDLIEQLKEVEKFYRRTKRNHG